MEPSSAWTGAFTDLGTALISLRQHVHAETTAPDTQHDMEEPEVISFCMLGGCMQTHGITHHRASSALGQGKLWTKSPLLFCHQ